MLWLDFVSLAENQMGNEEAISSLFVSLVPNMCYNNKQQKGMEEPTMTSFCFPDAFVILGSGICATRFKATQMVSAFRWLEPWLGALFLY
jgi:hypothetical protein